MTDQKVLALQGLFVYNGAKEGTFLDKDKEIYIGFEKGI